MKEEKTMKTLKLPATLIAILASTLVLSACGKTKRNGQTDAAPAPVASAPAPSLPLPPPLEPDLPDESEPTPGEPPLSFEFTKLGNQAIAFAGITTDNVLKVKFRVTPEQGNHIHKASELKVTIAMNGTEVTPTYTNSNYTYGQVGETSNVIDLSSYVTPGNPVTITVKSPKNDFYCTYVPNPFYYWDPNTMAYQPINPQYNAYPGCRKEVFSNHNWSGVLLVQTSATAAI
jgi:hypothetical protein